MTAAPRPPRQLVLAVVLWWIVALFLLLQTGLMWAGRAELPQQVLESGLVAPEEATSRAERLLWTNTALAVLFAAAYFGFGALLFRQQHWARIALSVVALCHLVMVLGTGAVFSVQAVVLVIGVLAVVFLWQRASTDWLTGER